jgi:hypothetical protein
MDHWQGELVMIITSLSEYDFVNKIKNNYAIRDPSQILALSRLIVRLGGVAVLFYGSREAFVCYDGRSKKAVKAADVFNTWALASDFTNPDVRTLRNSVEFTILHELTSGQFPWDGEKIALAAIYPQSHTPAQRRPFP